ncbi:hypothetical protein GIB67_016634 [Kingdonia uniflora]|uniref:Retrotransposon Copia-like N-terminal domain-containing protein n=1 Tax=Kingdonia uniflora TaxID=39325 RepID=A0A7J7MZT4_9MAGN|nr:hypothetical protein GIB67_016634 [Kingdonia uniflora]
MAVSDTMIASSTSESGHGVVSSLPTHPFENSSLQITTKKLDSRNYLLWAESAKMFIGERMKSDYITGVVQERAEYSSTYAKWFSDDSIVRSWLIHSMQPSIAAGYMFMKTSKQIWESVKKTYSQRQNNAHIFQLWNDVSQLKQGDLFLLTYYAKLRVVWEEMDHYQSATKWDTVADSEKYAKLIEKNRIFQFLQRLNSEFEFARVQLLGSDILPSLDEVYSLMLSYESCCTSLPALVSMSDRSVDQQW